MKTTFADFPNRDWNKKLEFEFQVPGLADPKTGEDYVFRIFSVDPQAHLIGVTKPVGLLEGYSADAILVKAFQKNYHTEAAKPKVVEQYGFHQKHSEPIEFIGFVYETIFDRACEAEMNRYRHNSKNLESGRYVDYIKHGLTIVFPDDVKTPEEQDDFLQHTVVPDLIEYAKALKKGAKRQAARRRLGYYLAVEGVYAINLRSLWHMARQRSQKLSPNGKEAEDQISSVVTQMVEGAMPHLPVFGDTVLKVISEGYR